MALSSMEAEYIALCAAAQEAVWLRMTLTDFDKLFNETIIIYDDMLWHVANPDIEYSFDFTLSNTS